MPDMIHLPTPQAAKHQAAGAGKPGASAPADPGQAQAFASVLRDKCAPADAQGGPQPAAEDTDTAAATAAETDTRATAAGAEPAPPVTDPAAMLAALLAAAPRPQAALRVTATATGTGTTAGSTSSLAGADTASGAATGGAGADARAWLAQFAGADARPAGAGREAAAGVTAPAPGSAAAAREPLDPKAGATAKTDFSELLGQARAESSSMTNPQNAATDLSASTLAMLQPVRELAEAQRAAPPRPATLIESPVGSPLFANEAAQRVTWLAKNGIEHAEIRVTPPDMGPIQVSIDMQQNEASITFFVTQTDTRVALEDSLHQLEEMLAESGIALSQASVGQQDAGQAFGGQSSGGGQRGTFRPGTGGDGGPDLAGVEVRRPMQARGLVDTFA